MISEDSGSSLHTVRPLGAETADICLRCSSQFIRHARFHFPLSAFLFATLMNLFFFFLLLKFCGFPVTAFGPTDKTPASKYVMETQPERTLITSPSLPLFSPLTFLPPLGLLVSATPRQTHFVSPCASVSYVAACASDLNSQRGFVGRDSRCEGSLWLRESWRSNTVMIRTTGWHRRWRRADERPLGKRSSARLGRVYVADASKSLQFNPAKCESLGVAQRRALPGNNREPYRRERRKCWILINQKKQLFSPTTTYFLRVLGPFCVTLSA